MRHLPGSFHISWAVNSNVNKKFRFVVVYISTHWKPIINEPPFLNVLQLVFSVKMGMLIAFVVLRKCAKQWNHKLNEPYVHLCSLHLSCFVYNVKLPQDLFSSCANDTCIVLSTKNWRLCGKLHVLLLHATMEYIEQGSTNTLYAHGLVHHFFNPTLGIFHSDEAGEAALRSAIRFARVTSMLF